MLAATNFKIQRTNFIAIYLVIGIGYLIYLTDRFFLNQVLLQSQTRSLYDIFILTIVLNLPHILASSLLISKYENFKSPSPQLRRILTFGLIVAFLLLTPLKAYIIVLFGLLTAYHVVSQQFGIVKIFGIRQTRIYTIWKWSGITTAMLILFRHTGGLFAELIPYVYFLNIVGLFSLSMILTKQNRTVKNGFALIWVNFLLAASSVFFDQAGYYLLAAVVTQFIHDTTAFYFYIIHNLNFEMTQKQRSLRRKEVLITSFRTVLTPVLFCLPLNLGAFGAFTLAISSFISIIHYSTESYIWSRNSPLRTKIQIK